MDLIILDPPQVLKCRKCEHFEEVTGDSWPALRKSAEAWKPCALCGGSMTLRCGTAPRKDRVNRCWFPAKPGCRCKFHGAKALKGAGAPNFKTGQHSRYVPQRYAAAFERAMGDHSTMRGQSHQLGMIAAMEDELMRKLDSGDVSDNWLRLKTLCQALRADLAAIRNASDAKAAGLKAKDLFARLENELFPIVESGVGDLNHQERLLDLYDRRARLVKQDVKSSSQTTVPIEVVTAMQGQFLTLMTRYILDKSVLSQIAAELRQMGPKTITLPAPRELGSGEDEES